MREVELDEALPEHKLAVIAPTLYRLGGDEEKGGGRGKEEVDEKGEGSEKGRDSEEDNDCEQRKEEKREETTAVTSSAASTRVYPSSLLSAPSPPSFSPSKKLTGLDRLKLGVSRLRLPPTPLDDLIDQLGGPNAVAEMTGRKVRVVRSQKSFVFEKRGGSGSDSAVEASNLAERAAFMDG